MTVFARVRLRGHVAVKRRICRAQQKPLPSTKTWGQILLGYVSVRWRAELCYQIPKAFDHCPVRDCIGSNHLSLRLAQTCYHGRKTPYLGLRYLQLLPQHVKLHGLSAVHLVLGSPLRSRWR